MILPGLYRGVVVTSKDPEGRRRIRARIPMILGEQSTEWAWPCFPPGTVATVPNPGEGVWIMFEAGDVSKPVWMGVWSTRAI